MAMSDGFIQAMKHRKLIGTSLQRSAFRKLKRQINCSIARYAIPAFFAHPTGITAKSRRTNTSEADKKVEGTTVTKQIIDTLHFMTHHEFEITEENPFSGKYSIKIYNFEKRFEQMPKLFYHIDVDWNETLNDSALKRGEHKQKEFVFQPDR